MFSTSRDIPFTIISLTINTTTIESFTTETFKANSFIISITIELFIIIRPFTTSFAIMD